MKNCATCNASFEDDVKFCASCGTAFPQPNIDNASGGALVHTIVQSENSEQAQTNNASQTNGAASEQINTRINQHVENHLVKSIIACVCCCLPFGVVAIIFASQVNIYLKNNDLNGALEASKKASLWSNLAIGAGVLYIVLWTAAMLFIGTASFGEFLNQLP